MKNYYDLTSKEKDKYMDEFKKTPGGKDLFSCRRVLLIITFIFFIGCCALGIYVDETTNLQETYETIDKFTFILVVITAIYSTYFNINFTAWLKNKHDIKRW